MSKKPKKRKIEPEYRSKEERQEEVKLILIRFGYTISTKVKL